MAKSYRQPGEVLDFTAPTGGVVSGVPLLIGALLVVPLITAAETVKFTAAHCGVWLLAKTTGVAWTEGQKLYWNDSTKKFSTVGADGQLAGLAVVAAASGDTTGYVMLNAGGLPELGEGAQAAIADPAALTDSPASADALRDDIEAKYRPVLLAILAAMRTRGDIVP